MRLSSQFSETTEAPSSAVVPLVAACVAAACVGVAGAVVASAGAGPIARAHTTAAVEVLLSLVGITVLVVEVRCSTVG
jgi:hypothetical protein